MGKYQSLVGVNVTTGNTQVKLFFERMETFTTISEAFLFFVDFKKKADKHDKVFKISKLLWKEQVFFH